MQQALAFPEGIHIPGLKPVAQGLARPRPSAADFDLPELDIRELCILMQKRRRK